MYEYFHISLYIIGIIIGVSSLISGFSQIYGGILGDKYGLKFILLLFSALSTLGYFLQFLIVLLFRNGYLFVFIFILTNLLTALYQPSSNALLALSRSNALGSFSIMRIMTNMGWALGPAVGGFLIGTYGFSIIYLISSITSLIALILYFFLMDIRNKTSTEVPGLVLNDKRIVIFGLGSMLLFVVVSQFSVTLSIYASVFTSISFGGIGLIYLVNGLVVVLLQWPTYLAIKRIKMWNGLILGTFLYMIGYFSLGFDHSLLSFITSMIIITMGENFTTPVENTITSIIAKEGEMASYMGAFNFFAAIGRSIGPAFGSFILAQVQNRMLIWFILILPGFISSYVFAYLKKRIKA